MSRDIRAGRAFVELFADKEQLERDLRAAEYKVRQFGRSVQAIGLGFTAIGAAAASAIVPAVSLFASFESTMSSVKAVTGATGDEFDALTKKARDLGASTSFSAKEAAEGMRFLGMAGFDTQQILAGIPAVLNLAKAGAVELGVAADIASDVSSAFGLTAEEIERVSDVMAKAASAANVSIEGLGESFTFAAPAGNAAGQTIEEVSAALATLGNSGLKGSIAGRNLQIIFRQLAAADVQKKLAAMNVAVADMDGNFRDLSDIIQDLRTPLSQLTEVERVNFLTDAFGESAKAAQILVSSADGFSDLRDELNNAAGAAQAMADVMSDNLTGDTLTLISAVQETALAYVQKLEPALRQIVQEATNAVRVTAEFITQNDTLVQVVTASAAAIGGLGLGLTAVGTAASLAATALSGLKLLAGPLTQLAPLIAMISKQWTIFTANIGIAISAVLTPAGLAIAGVVAGVAALGFGLAKLQQHFGVFDPLIAAVGRIIDRIQGELNPIIQLIGDRIANELAPIFMEFSSAIGAAFQQLLTAADPVIDLLGEFATVIAGGLLDSFINGVKMAANVLEFVMGAAIEYIKTELELLLFGLETAIATAESLGLIASREERERGARLDRELARIQKRREEEQGAPSPPQAVTDAAGKPVPKQSAEDLQASAEAASENVMASLKSFAESVKRSVQTPQEAFDEYMASLEEAFAEGLITAEEFRRGSEAQQAKLDDIAAREEEERQQQRDQAFRDKEQKFGDRFQSDISLARSTGDPVEELRALRRASATASKEGLKELALEFKQRELETLNSTGSNLESSIAQQKDNADLTTVSAMEAAFGLGQNTIDQEQLDQLVAIKDGQNRVTTELAMMREIFED